MRSSTWTLTLLLCSSCGGSSSETPPPLEPDPKRLSVPAESAASEELVPPPATTTAPAASSGNVEDGAEFGIESAGAHAAPANGASTHQTWGGAPSSPPSKAKRQPPGAP